MYLPVDSTLRSTDLEQPVRLLLGFLNILDTAMNSNKRQDPSCEHANRAYNIRQDFLVGQLVYNEGAQSPRAILPTSNSKIWVGVRLVELKLGIWASCER